MTVQENALNEQVSLYAHKTADASWLERMNEWDDVARLGEIFLLNSQVSDLPVRQTRLISEEAVREVGRWLAGTLQDHFEAPPLPGAEMSYSLSDKKATEIFGFPVGNFPPPYEEWRMSTEVYLVVGKICYLLMDGHFIRYRSLTMDEVEQLFSGRVAPFEAFDETMENIALVLSSVPNRLASFGGLRGIRRSILEAGVAQEWLKARLDQFGTSRWTWATEFYDDALCSILSLDGLERIPMCVAFRRDKGGLKAGENDGS